MTAYYNEIDPYAAQWLRNLIAAGHLAKGEVDERSITEVQYEDLLDFNQCHFFAGIGVWGYALRQAGWADDRPVWTGSCPCQPFSSAGKQEGFADERHLWPAWFKLIRKCRPPVIVGEQVASALDWLDLVSTDLEDADYAFGASDLCAAGFGGAHIRQRLYFTGVATANNAGLERHNRYGHHGNQSGRFNTEQAGSVAAGGGAGGLADTASARLEVGASETRGGRRQEFRPERLHATGRLADTECFGRKVALFDDRSSRAESSKRKADQSGVRQSVGGSAAHAPMLGRDAADWLYCRDDKWRPVRPGAFPLAHGAPARVGRLRAYGNALDAQTATQFVAAVMDCAP